MLIKIKNTIMFLTKNFEFIIILNLKMDIFLTFYTRNMISKITISRNILNLLLRTLYHICSN